jgi:hypothetical protein
MLFHGNTLFLNGEALVADINDLPLLMELADQRELPAGKAVSEALASKLYQWYCSGYLELE